MGAAKRSLSADNADRSAPLGLLTCRFRKRAFHGFSAKPSLRGHRRGQAGKHQTGSLSYSLRMRRASFSKNAQVMETSTNGHFGQLSRVVAQQRGEIDGALAGVSFGVFSRVVDLHQWVVGLRRGFSLDIVNADMMVTRAAVLQRPSRFPPPSCATAARIESRSHDPRPHCSAVLG